MSVLPILTGPRLDLRPVVDADLDDLWRLWTDPDVRRYLFDDTTISRERAADVLAACRAREADGLGLWRLVVRANGAMAGCAGLLPVSTVAEYEPRLAGAIEVLIALHPGAWHVGFASEAVTSLLAYGFDVLRLPMIAAATDTPNAASQRLLARVGFVPFSECDGPLYRMLTFRMTARDAPLIPPQ